MPSNGGACFSESEVACEPGAWNGKSVREGYTFSFVCGSDRHGLGR